MQRSANDRYLHAGASVRSASAAAARGAAARSRGQARARLSQLDPQPPQISPPRGAGRAGRRHAGAAAGPHRGDRRSRQPGAGGGIHAGPGLARKRRHAAAGHGRSRQSRRLCPRHAAPFRRHVRAVSARRRRRGRWHAVSVRAPARAAGADRRLLGGADAAADGHRPARPRAARCARSPSGADCPPRRPSGCCWFIIPCTRIRG